MSQTAGELLANTRLFGSMSPDSLERLASRATRRSVRRGEVIVHEGDPGDALFVIVTGLVKVYVTSDEGDEMLLVTLGPASIFGELPLVDGGARSASAAAVEPTTLLTLTRAALMDALHSDPHLVDSLLRALGAMVRRLTDQAADLVFLDLQGRVAKLLLALAEESSSVEDGAQVLDLNLTQGELASMVGGSRQSVNQVLHSLARLGYLELDGRRIVIRDARALRRRAGSRGVSPE